MDPRSTGETASMNDFDLNAIASDPERPHLHGSITEGEQIPVTDVL